MLDCLVDPSELRERLRQARWPIPHLQRAHDTGGRYAPEFQRSRGELQSESETVGIAALLDDLRVIAVIEVEGTWPALGLTGRPEYWP